MSKELIDCFWEKVGVVIFIVNGKDYIVLVDYFLNFWEVK